MPSVKMLTITVYPGGLSLRRSGSSARNTALPDLPETVEFQNDVDCMAFSSDVLTKASSLPAESSRTSCSGRFWTSGSHITVQGLF